MQALPAAVVAEHGSVALLVNNGGVSVAAPVEALDLDDLEWLMGVNFFGAVHGCRFFLPHLRRAPRAHVCNVLSDFALFGRPTKSPYCASKFAVRIVRGIERGRSRVLIGKETWAIDLATRLAPVLTNRLVGRLRTRVPFL